MATLALAAAASALRHLAMEVAGARILHCGTAARSAFANNKPQSSRAVLCHLLVKGNGLSFAISDRFAGYLRRRFPLHGKSVRDIA